MQLMALLLATIADPRPGQWDPDPDWFEEHCPVCGEESLEGDILPRALNIEFKKWVERYEDGILVLRRITIPLICHCWFHRDCLRTYEGRTGGA